MRFALIYIIIVPSAFALNIRTALTSYEKNEDFQLALNEIDLFKATEAQAKGSILPTLELNSNFTRQDSTNNSFVGAEQRQTFLSLRQPLFRGFSEFNAIDYAEKLSQTKKFAKEIVKRELQLQIADKFMQAYRLRREIDLFKELLKINNQNYQLIQQREKIGKSKKSDLLSAKANVLQLKAELTQLNEQLSTSLIDLKRVAGIKEDLSRDKMVFSQINHEQNFKLNDHPSVKTAKLLYEAGEDLIDQSEGGHYPQVDFNANYYLEQEGVFNQREWDMAVNLTFPLYEGGRTSNEIRAQELNKKRNFITYERTKRDLETLLSKIETQSDLINQQLRAYELSVAASYRSYKEILKDYKLRLTTNLELNNALETYLQEKRKLLELDTKKKFLHLQNVIIKGAVL